MSEDARTGKKLLIRKEFTIAGQLYVVDLYSGAHPTIDPTDTVIVDQTSGNYNVLVLQKGVTPPPPVVKAVITPALQTVTTGSTVNLDGTKSTGSIVSFKWAQVSGPPITINNANQAIANFVEPNTLLPIVVSLTVADANTHTDVTDAVIQNQIIPPPPGITVQDLAATTTIGTPVQVLLQAMDTNVGATSITLQIDSQPAHGTANIIITTGATTPPLTGSVHALYTPTAGFSGTDSFKYSASDNLGNKSLEGTVTITVGTTPPPPTLTVSNVSLTTQENTNAVGTLTATDSISGAAVTFSTVANATHGTDAITGSTVMYAPTPGFTGTDSFTFVAKDNHGQTSNTGTVSITVTPTGGGGGTDVFGVKKVYGDWTASPASNWTMTNDPNGDPRGNNPEASSSFKPKFTANADGSFKIHGQLEIRGAITQNNGYNESKLCTDFTLDRKNGYMQDSLDWGAGKVGLEMTAYYRINQAGTGTSNGEAHIEHVMKGQRSTTSNTGVGVCGKALGCADNYHCNIYNNKGSSGPARQKFEKDLFHTTGYSTDVTGVNNNTAYNFKLGQFQGFKTVVYLVPNGSGGNNAVLEHWTDETATNTWKKTHTFTDTGANWPPRGSIGNCNLPPSPSGSPVIDFGGPLTVFRSDNIQDYDMKWASIRSIDPSVKNMGAEHDAVTTVDLATGNEPLKKRTVFLDGHEEIKLED